MCWEPVVEGEVSKLTTVLRTGCQYTKIEPNSLTGDYWFPVLHARPETVCIL